MKKIYLVRHGESQWNVLKKIQGQQDVPLTDKGIIQAQQMGERLLDEGIDLIYSSDLQRAYNTANIIGEKLEIDVESVSELREIKFGQWEGIAYDKVLLSDYKELLLWRKAPEKLNIDGIETLKKLQNRAMMAIDRIIKDEKANNILIVSHSATLKTIILGLLNMDLANFKNFTLDNVGLSIIEFRDYNNVLTVLNDTNHIKEI